MNITEQQIFEAKKQLQEHIEQFEKQLQELIKKQLTITKVEELAKSVLEYNRIQHEIEDRSHVFSLLSAPQQSLRSPFVKAELFSYLEAAETVSPELVDLLADDVLTQLRTDIQNEVEDTTTDLILAEYREYILPAKMMAERFDQIDMLLLEMNRYCKALDANYNDEQAHAVLKYALRVSIYADTRMEPTIRALREMQFQYITDEDRAELLDHVEEHMAILRFEAAKKQQLAMEQAVRMLEKREEQPKK